MKKNFIIANWKCNPTTLTEAKRLFNSYSSQKIKNNTQLIICPPFIYLEALSRIAKKISIGAQDSFWEEKGAYTGQISPVMLKNLGVKYVILGHSERRKYASETDELINKKLKMALGVGLKAILCVGETLEEKKRGTMHNILSHQTHKALQGVNRKQIKNLIIAYEPIWAIGTGKACSIQDAISAGLFIKRIIFSRFGRKTADELVILYGGSVNSQNYAAYIKEAALRGLLIGGASLDAREFIKIIEETRGA